MHVIIYVWYYIKDFLYVHQFFNLNTKPASNLKQLLPKHEFSLDAELFLTNLLQFIYISATKKNQNGRIVAFGLH